MLRECLELPKGVCVPDYGKSFPIFSTAAQIGGYYSYNTYKPRLPQPCFPSDLLSKCLSACITGQVSPSILINLPWQSTLTCFRLWNVNRFVCFLFFVPLCLQYIIGMFMHAGPSRSSGWYGVLAEGECIQVLLHKLEV